MTGNFETPQRVWAMAGVPETAEGPTYILFLRVVSFNVVYGFLASVHGESPAPPLVLSVGRLELVRFLSAPIGARHQTISLDYQPVSVS
jgi:hypothetical protein